MELQNIKNIHIGSIIREKLTEKSMTITYFAIKINRERTTVYDIFQRKSIDIELLIEISKVLDYDFIHEIYFEEKTSSNVFIAIKIKEEEIKNVNLPEDFIKFLKSEQ